MADPGGEKRDVLAEGGPAPAKYKQKMKLKIELDPVEPTIIVNIETTVLDPTQLGADGTPLVVQRNQNQNRIKLKTFNPQSNVQAFAAQIIAKCKVIPENQSPYIERLLENLARRLAGQAAGAPPATAPAPVAAPVPVPVAERPVSQPIPVAQPIVAAPAPQPVVARPVVAAVPVAAPVMAGQTMAGAGARTVVRPAGPAGAVTAKPVPALALSAGNEEDEEAEVIREPSSAAAAAAALSRPRSAAGRRPSQAAAGAAQASSSSSSSAAASTPAPVPVEETKTKKKKVGEASSSSSVSEGKKPAAKDKDKKSKDKEKDKDKSAKEKKDKVKDKDKPKKKPAARKAVSSSLYESSSSSLPSEKADMDRMEAYVEMLYEDSMQDKIRGTSLLLQLVQNPVNLDAFIQNETVLGALSRVLIEERKKSTELVTNILEIFFCFSSFRQLHHILQHNKIGETTMRIIELEIKRYELKLDGAENDKEKLKSLTSYLEKQDKLMFVCFYILLNLAEDTAVEQRLVEKRLIKHLTAMLGRKTRDKKLMFDLHVLVLTFLKKLSIFVENKNEMIQCGVMTKLLPYMDWDNDDVLDATLRLLFNMAFDANQRDELVTAGTVPKIVRLVNRPAIRMQALRLLYLISMDDRHKIASDSSLAPAVPTMVQLMIRSPSKHIEPELVALAINLVASPQNAELLAANDSVGLLLKRLSSSYDPLLVKLLRNASDHPSVGQTVFVRFLPELSALTVKAPSLKSQNQEFLVEALGILANVHTPSAGFAELIVKHGLLDFVMKHLVLGFADDDVLLQAVMVVGSMALDPKSGSLLANMRLVRMLFDALKEKFEDIDIALQVVYTVYRLLVQPSSRDAVLGHGGLCNLLVDLVLDPDPSMRTLANLCLDIMQDHDVSWRDRIRTKRFELANRHWLQLIQSHGDEPPLSPTSSGGLPSPGQTPMAGATGLSVGIPSSPMHSLSQSPASTPGSTPGGAYGRQYYEGHDAGYGYGDMGSPPAASQWESRGHLQDMDDLSEEDHH